MCIRRSHTKLFNVFQLKEKNAVCEYLKNINFYLVLKIRKTVREDCTILRKVKTYNVKKIRQFICSQSCHAEFYAFPFKGVIKNGVTVKMFSVYIH